MIVYRLKNIITGKSYIGQTVKSLNTRWSQHISNSRPESAYHKNSLIAQEILRFGEEAFEVTVLCRAQSVKELNDRESSAIRLFKTLHPNGYNLVEGGRSGRKASALTKSRMALRKCVRAPHSEATKEKIRASNVGQRRSALVRYNMVLSNAHKKKPVSLLDLNSGFVLDFTDRAEASRELGVIYGVLCNAIRLGTKLKNRYMVLS